MRSLSLPGLVLAGLVAASGAARAETTFYYRAGAWRAFSGAGPDGRLVCGMQTGLPDGRTLDIRAVIGTPGLLLTASRPTWQVPAHTQIPVGMAIGGAASWSAPAEAEGEGHEITWRLPPGEAGAFQSAFRAGSVLTLSFPSGNEPPWQVSLNGSSATDATFLRCVNDYAARAGQAAPTQPFVGGGNPTQPFAEPNAPSPGAPPPASAPALPPLPPLPRAGG